MADEYIKREAVLSHRTLIPGFVGEYVHADRIREVPAADVAPVIFCRKCAHHGRCAAESIYVPPQIIRDIAQVRMYGNQKYGDPQNWMTVQMRRYVNALMRHALCFMENPNSVDEESGIPHYKHMACNMAFICQMMEGKNETSKSSIS